MQQNFEEREIGRYGKIHWPARSPDLTPMDFFVWGWVKDQVYRQPVDSLDELKVRIAQTGCRWTMQRTAFFSASRAVCRVASTTRVDH